jgi:hypothetical protein
MLALSRPVTMPAFLSLSGLCPLLAGDGEGRYTFFKSWPRFTKSTQIGQAILSTFARTVIMKNNHDS